ncbi:MAG TPA: DNA gyrase C-terminal beta-propeller domain-containing protein, partial [Gemmatales bacterium]|nr:DNA gyrase C-terminal beta-propeller domain-containing protein [Gemmatales bacterium]
MLCSLEGRVIHFPISEIPVLAGVGKGVMGIKLDEGDLVLGGALIRNQNDLLSVETSGGKTMDFYGSRELVSRAGKGFEAVKRTSFTRVLPAPISLVNWEQFETPAAEKNGKLKGNLFDRSGSDPCSGGRHSSAPQYQEPAQGNASGRSQAGGSICGGRTGSFQHSADALRYRAGQTLYRKPLRSQSGTHQLPARDRQ